VESIFSRELANLAGVTPSQVRVDLMGIGYQGTSTRGYDVTALAGAITKVLDGGQRQTVVLVGVGHLGRAILQYFHRNHPALNLLAAFEGDTELIGRRICGTPVLDTEELLGFVRSNGVNSCILSLPAEAAQEAADLLIAAGIRSLLNFTNVHLKVPDEVYVENTDISVSLERMAFFGRKMHERSEQRDSLR